MDGKNNVAITKKREPKKNYLKKYDCKFCVFFLLIGFELPLQALYIISPSFKLLFGDLPFMCKIFMFLKHWMLLVLGQLERGNGFYWMAVQRHT